MRVLFPLVWLLLACSSRRLPVTVDAGAPPDGEIRVTAPPVDAAAVPVDGPAAVPDLAEDLPPALPDAAPVGAADAKTADARAAANVIAQEGDFILEAKPADLTGVPVGETMEVDFLLTYTGASASVIGMPLSGPLQYEVTGSGFSHIRNDCPVPPRGLFARSPCWIHVAFRPVAVGPHEGRLSVSAMPGGLALATLAGTGVPPGVLKVSSERLEFPPTSATGGRASLEITLTNLGPASVSEVSEGILDEDNFGLVPNCDQRFLRVGESCTSEVVFRPQGPGPRTSSYLVRAGNQRISVTLTGTGI